jgi:myo-inositol 2-dehydrogenase/D-chiro-inositol 1-dehydrogenase
MVRMRAMQSVRIGLIGAGMIGHAHAAVLRGLAGVWPDRVALAAVADPDERARTRCQSVHGIADAYAEPRALLDDGAIDAVFICTPTVFHAELVRAAAAAGKHIFCEKPLAMSHAEGLDMLAVVRRAEVKAQVGLVLRFSAVYTVMRDLLRTPQTGAPVAVVFRDDQCFPIRGIHHTGWRKDRRLSAGGTLIEHGVHDLDLLTWFFGPVARLRAWQQNRAGHPGVEDYMAIELEFASGLRAQLVNLWHDLAARASNRRLEIFCQRGFVASEHDMLGDVTLQLGDGEATVLDAGEVLARFEALLGRPDTMFRDWYGIPYLLQDLQFVEALLNDRAPAPSLEVGLAAQHLAEAAYRAAASGDEIEI